MTRTAICPTCSSRLPLDTSSTTVTCTAGKLMEWPRCRPPFQRPHTRESFSSSGCTCWGRVLTPRLLQAAPVARVVWVAAGITCSFTIRKKSTAPGVQILPSSATVGSELKSAWTQRSAALPSLSWAPSQGSCSPSATAWARGAVTAPCRAASVSSHASCSPAGCW